MSHLNNVSGGGFNAMTLKSSSSTTHSTDDDLLGSQVSSWYATNAIPTMPQHIMGYFKAGTNVTTNLSSYSAGDTLYARIFMKSNSASYAYFFVHSNVSIIYYVDEVQI